MHTIQLFGFTLNGLEFVTYVLIPLAMVLIIIVYIVSNLRLLELCFNFDTDTQIPELDGLTESYITKFNIKNDSDSEIDKEKDKKIITDALKQENTQQIEEENLDDKKNI